MKRKRYSEEKIISIQKEHEAGTSVSAIKGAENRCWRDRKVLEHTKKRD